jgi:hypothetical protein
VAPSTRRRLKRRWSGTPERRVRRSRVGMADRLRRGLEDEGKAEGVGRNIICRPLPVAGSAHRATAAVQSGGRVRLRRRDPKFLNFVRNFCRPAGMISSMSFSCDSVIAHHCHGTALQCSACTVSFLPGWRTSLRRARATLARYSDKATDWQPHWPQIQRQNARAAEPCSGVETEQRNEGGRRGSGPVVMMRSVRPAGGREKIEKVLL